MTSSISCKGFMPRGTSLNRNPSERHSRLATGKNIQLRVPGSYWHATTRIWWSESARRNLRFASFGKVWCEEATIKADVASLLVVSTLQSLQPCSQQPSKAVSCFCWLLGSPGRTALCLTATTLVSTAYPVSRQFCFDFLKVSQERKFPCRFISVLALVYARRIIVICCYIRHGQNYKFLAVIPMPRFILWCKCLFSNTAEAGKEFYLFLNSDH